MPLDKLSPRETLDRSLKHQLEEVIALGNMVQQATLDAVEALKQRDFDASRRVYDGDQAINEKRFHIEGEVLILIATQQPMAHDLRMLAGILEIITELERMGDYAKGIGRINLLIGDQPLVKPLIDVPIMAQKATDMLHRALVAFVAEDVEAARSIPKDDDQIDELHNQTQHELLNIMKKDSNLQVIDQCNNLMWAAHNLERFADRVTNICERTIFVATGEMTELDSSDDEQIE